MSSVPNPPEPEPITLEPFGQLVGVAEPLPFDISRRQIQWNSSARRIRRDSRQSMIYRDAPDSEPHFRLPLLPLVELELNRRSVPFNTLPQPATSRLNVTPAQAVLTNDIAWPLGIASTSVEFIRTNQHSLVEHSRHWAICALIGASSLAFRPARIAVLTVTHDSCWQLKRRVDRFSGPVQSFVAFDELSENEIDRRWPRQNWPQIVIGTPDSLARNNRFAGSWQFDLIFIADERLLPRESLLDYLVSASPGTHIVTCVSQRIATDPRWQPELYEYSGFARGILTRGGQIWGQPRLEFVNVNWQVSGNLQLTEEIPFVDALDSENRRLRAVSAVLRQRRFNSDDNKVVVVFARQRSVEAFRRLNKTYVGLQDATQIHGPNARMAMTIDELSRVRGLNNTIVVWAGSRVSSGDFYRMLLPRLSAGATLTVVDVQDFPHTRNEAQVSFTQTVADWNRSRRREYEQLGYIPAGGDAIQHTMDRASRLLIRNAQPGSQNV